MMWCGPRISEYSLSAVSQVRFAQSAFEAGNLQSCPAQSRLREKFCERFPCFDFFFFVFLNIGNKTSAARLNTPEDGKQAAIDIHCSFCMLRHLTTNRQKRLDEN